MFGNQINVETQIFTLLPLFHSFFLEGVGKEKEQ